ncbi:MAG TPA: SMC-Scp complex subunit ScpB [Terriglobia bacterium]|jgi:segregation and condensation protein B|nr:SMC-Scp complex subunit ScpB [Terriglobia bacterium]
MLTDETLKAVIEAIIYVAPEPVSLDAILKALEGEERDRVKAQIENLIQEYSQPGHGIEVRQIAGGYRFSSKPEHHEVLRKFVKSLKPPIRLSRPALETLAVIAYRQPVTLPEIEEIRGVDCGGVIHTLLEKKLVVTAGRKDVVGRPILYRTSKEFLVHFGLKDINELPSLKEFEELARQALGPELPSEQEQQSTLAERGSPVASSEKRAEIPDDLLEVPGMADPVPNQETFKAIESTFGESPEPSIKNLEADEETIPPDESQA